MEQNDKVNILLVDDQPAKLLSYEVVLRDLDENLIKAASATEALELLLRNDIAVILVDVCMPDLDGFELAAMIRNHPRFQRTAIIFISAVLLADTDYLRGYEMGAVDYVPVPVVPQLLRAKVRVFAELYRKTRDLEKLNQELESRVAERTAALQAAAERLRESERGRSIALAAGQMGSWDWDIATGECIWDAGQCRIFGVEPQDVPRRFEDTRQYVHHDDLGRIEAAVEAREENQTFQTEIRVTRPNGEIRWCICAGAMTTADDASAGRVSIVMIDITDRKLAEERQLLLAREVDHRARNALAVVQAIVRLTHAGTPQAFVKAVEGRIRALAHAHTLLSETRWQGADVGRLVAEELAPYRSGESGRVQVAGPAILFSAEKAQNLALALHELATNSAKYGALSSPSGVLRVTWENERGALILRWQETGGPPVRVPSVQGFGTKIMNASIKQQIGGHVAWDWNPSGLICTIQIPDSANCGVGRQASESRANNLVHLATGAQRRILLVEDEAIVGMMMRDLLLDYGLFVIGPCGSVAEAMAVAEDGQFDCAVLDLNLGNEMVYPVAETLVKRKIPIAFVTGYGRESIDERFKQVPVIQKPIARESLEQYLRYSLGPAFSSLNVTPGSSGKLDSPNATRV